MNLGRPTPEKLRRLARSSPWRWTTVRFVASWRHSAVEAHAVRAWIRRPDGLRIEGVDRLHLTATLWRQHPWGPPGHTQGADGQWVRDPDPFGPQSPQATPPVLDDHGLVLKRPQQRHLRYDDPMYDDYRWVAMLDPVELADGYEVDHQGGAAPNDRAPLDVEVVDEVDHFGRACWEAIVRPNSLYYPRCSCCPLLHSAASDQLDSMGGGPAPCRSFADAHRVLLDLQTGICVLTEELGGPNPGRGHQLVIESVDEHMSDDLFDLAFEDWILPGWSQPEGL